MSPRTDADDAPVSHEAVPEQTSPSEPAPRTTFSSLHVPAYRRLFFAGTASFMAVQMQFLLRGVLAWDLTEREGALGLVYFVFGVSMLVATPLGGVAADRLPNRTVLLASQTVLTIGAAGVGLAVVTDVIEYWMLLLASVAQGISFGFYGPTRMAFSAKLVGADQLGNAITLSMLSLNGTRIFAPSFAGALAGIALFGIGGAYLVAAGFSVVAFFLITRCPAGAPTATATTDGPFTQIWDGVTYVARYPHLRRLVVSSFFVIMFGFNYVAFVPAFVKDVFERGDGSVGLLMSASSIGAVVIAASLARNADGPHAQRLMVVSGVLFGLFVIALAGAPTYWLAFGVTALVGASTTGYQSLSNTLALGMTDESHRGRVQSLMMLSFAGFGIAAAPLGLLAEVIGLRWAMAIMGVVAATACAVYGAAEWWLHRATPHHAPT
ncbi:MAG: MFS transporter [Actinomycetota bacterium]